MKAMHATRYGGPEVLELKEVPRPVPKPGQVLIRVHAASVTLGDCEVRASKLMPWVVIPLRLALGIFRPRQPVLGMELAGEVVAVGAKVARFRPGDRVSGSSGFAMGAYREYAVVSEKAAISPIPATLSYAEVVGIPTGGFNGLHFVRHAALEPGDHVLINGAAGSIGMFAVQLARQLGATVTAVDHGDKAGMLRGIGADHVIDYRASDFWQSDQQFDAVIDIVGNPPFAPMAARVSDGGRLVLGNPSLRQMLGARRENKLGRIRAKFAFAGEPVADLDWLKGQIAEGSLRMVIDRVYRLEHLVEAHRYVEGGKKSGVVVIDVSGHAGGRDTLGS